MHKYINVFMGYVLGSFGVHTTMSSTDKESHEFYGKLGFVDLNPAHEEYPGIKTMCRSF